MKIFDRDNIRLWTQQLLDWLENQFAAVASSIDFTPVEEKLDEVKGDVADVKTAVENIDFTPVAKDATVAKEAVATVNKETIMGGKLPVNTAHSIPAILWDDDIKDIDNEGELFMHSNVLAPEGFGVGSVVTAENMTDGEEDMYYVAKAVNNPSVSYDGQDYSISGATFMIVEKGKCYRCTSIVPLSYTEGDETIIGELYVYEEYEPGRSIKEVYNALGHISPEDPYSQTIAQFFGLADSYEAEAKGGERTNNTVIDECKVRFQDAFNGLLPTGFTMPNSVTVDNLTYTGTTNS